MICNFQVMYGQHTDIGRKSFLSLKEDTCYTHPTSLQCMEKAYLRMLEIGTDITNQFEIRINVLGGKVSGNK